MIEAKMGFLGGLEKRIGGIVTAEAMPRILSAAADLLDGYEMRHLDGAAAGERDDLLEYYLGALRVQGRSPKTVERYEGILRHMLRGVGTGCRMITVHHLRSFLAAEKARGLQDSTLESERQIYSAFFGWLHREGLIERNPVANLGPIKVAKKKRLEYSDVDLQRIHEQCRTARDRAIVAFLETTGCRVSEMTGLDRDAVDLEHRECIVRGKGDKERRVYFDTVTAMLLRRYLDGRKDGEPALFVGLRGERLRPNGVRYMLGQLAKRAGVENVHPHRFRRTLATRLARHGMPVQEVAAVLGHEKIDTTMRYVVQSGEDIRNDYRRFAS